MRSAWSLQRRRHEPRAASRTSVMPATRSGSSSRPTRPWSRSSPESGRPADYDGHTPKKGARTRAAVETPGHLPAVPGRPASTQEPAQVAGWPRRCRRSPVGASHWPPSTEVRQAGTRPPTAPRTASVWRWSSIDLPAW